MGAKKEKKYFFMQHWKDWEVTANIVPTTLKALGNLTSLLTAHHETLQYGHSGTFASTLYIVRGDDSASKILMLVLASNNTLHIIMRPSVDAEFSKQAFVNLTVLHSARTSLHLPSF
jgi:hypothetical protein